MNKEELKEQVDKIIAKSWDNETAHVWEDNLHLELIQLFCPDWVNEEIDRLNKSDFTRWHA